MGKEAKTNAMRILEREKVAYTAHEYPHEEGVAVDGVTVAASIGEDPACVYKTLVTQGSSKNYFVFVIPVAAELDLKAAARSVGEKSVAMIHVADINKVTGYVRGGCSPVGMKKQYRTVFDESVLTQQKVYVSGGRIGTQVCCAPADLIRAARAATAKIIFLKIRRDIWDTSTQPLHKIYLPHKSYLKRKRMAKLHKTFESFLTAWEHKGEFAQTLFAKRFFCRKLYLVQGRCPKKRACIAA